MPREAEGKRPHQHFARGCHRLQSLSGIHRIAGHRIGFGNARTESTCNHVPGVDADMQYERQTGAYLRTFSQLRRPPDHVEGRPKRPLRVVFVRGRRTKQGEQRIADEFVHEAAKILHRCRQLLEQFVLESLHDFRVEPLAHRGEATEVGKQHGNGAAVSFGIDLVGLWPKCLLCLDRRVRRRR